MRTVEIVVATLAGLWLIKQLMQALANVLKRRIQEDTKNCGFCYQLGAARWVYVGKKRGERLGVCAKCLPVALGPVPIDWALQRGYLVPASNVVK